MSNEISFERRVLDLKQKRIELEKEMRKEICQKLGHLWITKTKTIRRHEGTYTLMGCKCELKIIRVCRICGEIGDICYKEGGYPDSYPDGSPLSNPIPEEYKKELEEMKLKISETELGKRIEALKYPLIIG